MKGVRMVDLARDVSLVALLALAATATPGQAQSLPVPQNLTATAEGTLVRLAWMPVTGLYRFRIEAGSAPGLTDIAAFSTPVMAAGSEFAVPAVPTGRYFVRLRTELDGQLSAPSNEAELLVTGCAEPPVAPTLSAQASGQLVTVQWAFPPSLPGCGPTHLRLQAGRTPGATDVLDIDVPDWNITVRHFAAVPVGAYYLRARVSRGVVTGGVSNEVTLNVGCLPPAAIVNPQVRAVGNAARFSWQYGAPGGMDFDVVLEAGSTPGAADIASMSLPYWSFTGFNVAGAAGSYYTRLRASNACGSTVSAELPVTLTAECVVPDPIAFIDASMTYQPGSVTAWWEPATSGGLVMAYDVRVGTAPGLADIARRIVEGRYAAGPPPSFPAAVPRAYLRVLPMNACGAAARPADAHAAAAPCPNPPAPSHLSYEFEGSAVRLSWAGTGEMEDAYLTFIEIGHSPGAADVLMSPAISSYGFPTFVTTLPPGQYYARARRQQWNCNELSNPSPEVTFVVP